MTRHRFPRRSRSILVAGVLTMTLLPLQVPTLTTHAAENSITDRRRPADPCAGLLELPAQAKRLRGRCDFGGGSGVARGDFNGDGEGDLAIGVPYENVNGGPNDAGAVNVIYGSPGGLTSTGNQFLTQDSPGVPGTAEAGDHFGRTLAAVDQNGDGFSDLAIGVPQENGDEGLVQMMIGSPAGLIPGPAYTFNSMEGGSCHCAFGSALAWGDFDRDNLGDLAIGMPNYVHLLPEPLPLFEQLARLGAVMVQYSDIGGHQLLLNKHEERATRDPGFGTALAAGDHDGDGFDDLAIGAPRDKVECGFSLHLYCQTVSTTFQPGSVRLYRGSSSQLQYLKDLYQGDNYGVDLAHTAGGLSENGDQFGRTLAFGDFDDDGRDELVVGAPYEDVGDRADAGAVSVFYDLPPVASNIHQDRTFTQNDLSGATAQSDDLFGRALAGGDFDGDGREDLAIGAPGEDHGSPFNIPPDLIVSAGIVHVLYGEANLGLPPGGGRSQIWHQNTSGVPGIAEAGDEFGFALSAWNFGKTSHRDLAIGVPYEDIEGNANAGAVLVLYGSDGGLIAGGAQTWSQDSPGIIDAASADDRFGAALY